MKLNKLLMAWNEPGKGSGNQKDQNPWGKSNEPGPPDLEKLLKQGMDKLKSIFNQKSAKPNSSNSKESSFNPNNPRNNHASFFNPPRDFKQLFILIGLMLVVLYGLAGIYIVDPPESAVITRFGQYIRTEGPGPHWLPVLFESREIVNVEQVATSDHSGLMLTKDRNIAQVGVAVQYRIGDGPEDVKAFLFNVQNPVHSLKQSAESALRQVVGQYTMDEVLTLKRAEIANAIKEQIIDTLKPYNTGIMVLDVAMQFAKPPDEVRAAFDDVIRAAADEERLVNQARAYENQILPEAKGTAERKRYDSLAYKQETILKAQGEIQRFNLILPEYQKAPKVTQTRLYLDSMEEVLSRVNKIITDSNAGSNFFFMPLEKMVKTGTSPLANVAQEEGEPSYTAPIPNAKMPVSSVELTSSNMAKNKRKHDNMGLKEKRP